MQSNIPIILFQIAISKGTGGLEIWRTSGDHPNYYIIENGQNTEKSPGNLRRLAFTQTPVKNYPLTLVWKWVNNNNDNFEIQTDHLISARRPDLERVENTKNLPNSQLCRLGEPQSENQRKRKERQILVLCQRTNNYGAGRWRWYQL